MYCLTLYFDLWLVEGYMTFRDWVSDASVQVSLNSIEVFWFIAFFYDHQSHTGNYLLMTFDLRVVHKFEAMTNAYWFLKLLRSLHLICGRSTIFSEIPFSALLSRPKVRWGSHLQNWNGHDIYILWPSLVEIEIEWKKDVILIHAWWHFCPAWF